MDSADHTGARKTAAGETAGTAAQAVRYIITRPCLAEGSLRLLKYLQPLFPAEGQVALQDGRGERFQATVDPVQGRLIGLGELYRAHNLGVNDVLLISPAISPGGPYPVECVVKPHARPATAPERPAPPAPVTEKRVVIHATPHVREVRLERVTSETARTATETRPAETRPEGVSRPTDTVRQEASQARAAPIPAQPVGQVGPVSPGAVQQGTVQQARTIQPNPGQPGPVRTTTVQVKTTGQATPFVQARPPSAQPTSGNARQPGRPAAPITWVTARMQQHPAPPIRLASALNTPIQMSFPATLPDRGAPQPKPSEASRRTPVQARGAILHSEEAQGTSARPGPALPVPGQELAPARQDGEATTSVRPPQATPASPEAPGEVADRPQHLETQNPGVQHPEDQLAALARLTGYGCEHLGSGVVRLRAELGAHSYSVLIATTPQALTTHAWSESCDYMALLTPEDQRPQGIPRFTYTALEALLDNARLAPLTPIDLRGYWNTGSFDQESVESVGELVSAHLGQRGSFSHVLLTLAQQPAHSLVSLPRLAERLGSGVNTAELQSILETLSRPPFMALSPLPGGQYYLRSDVRDLLDEFGAYAEGLRRRLRPTPLATAGR